MFSFGGQISQFVTDYLDAPVSLKEIAADMGKAGASVDPAGLGGLNQPQTGDETQFRYYMSHLEKKVLAYNSFFDATGADLIMIPAAAIATPDLAALASGTAPRTTLPSGGTLTRSLLLFVVYGYILKGCL